MLHIYWLVHVFATSQNLLLQYHILNNSNLSTTKSYSIKSKPNIHKPAHICPLEQQELYDGTATAGVPVSNCGRDLQKLPHPAGHMMQGSGSLASPPPPVTIQYGSGWI